MNDPKSLYKRWSHMMGRCYNPGNRSYKDYGERGITVCDRWHDFRNYMEDINAIGIIPPGETIDRTNNDGNYEPGNVRFADDVIQIRNRRNTIFVEHKGETKPLAEWAEQLNIPYHSFLSRLPEGYSFVEAAHPKDTISQLARDSGVSNNTIKYRLGKGMSVDEATNPDTSTDVYYTHQGITKTLTQWSKDIGIKKSTIFNRVRQGWNIDEALTSPTETDPTYDINGLAMNLSQIAKHTGIKRTTLVARLSRGQSIDRIAGPQASMAKPQGMPCEWSEAK